MDRVSSIDNFIQRPSYRAVLLYKAVIDDTINRHIPRLAAEFNARVTRSIYINYNEFCAVVGTVLCNAIRTVYCKEIRSYTRGRKG